MTYGNWTPGLFIPHRRQIGGIVATVTIEEQSEDDLQITDHPVEQGAPISDHAFKRPVSVTIRAGWSVASAYDLSAETGIYGLLLSWQAALMPFDVITGKRSYTNMLIERLQVVTDQHSEWALMATISCRQVIIVQTQTTSVTGSSTQAGDHADPASTGPTQDGGDKPSINQGTVSPASVTEGPGTGAGSELTPTPPSGPGSSAESELGASTPRAAAVQQQLNANGASVPNAPQVPAYQGPTSPSADLPSVVVPPFLRRRARLVGTTSGRFTERRPRPGVRA
jgi:hypothetical protein